MKYILYVYTFVLIVSCKPDKALFQSKELKKEIEARLKVQKDLASNRSDALFNILDSSITSEEKELLEFLFAYMPLSDLADYDGNYFLQQVKYSLLARKTFDWGKKIPNDIFLHFVLPYRVNNEYPDSGRKVFYEELKQRVINLSMKEAALEVNHWCHEKVTYHPSDIRTSAPLSTVKNALGRCGEESTFTVTAMRAVGIPARQIYTPRWAHSDDNHAWVEVWVDGEWYFLGACEPEPDLDMGWFAEPATRAMLLHSRVFGNYITDDDVVTHNDRYTEINVLPDYATAKRVYVQVFNTANDPVDSALVQYQLYNYAEFYPIAKMYTNNNGLCSLLTGYGDLIAWASKDGLIANKQLRVSETDTLKLVLQENRKSGTQENYELIPPPKGEIVKVSDEKKRQNDLRLRYEDSLRTAYEKTFIDSIDAVKVAESLGINPEETWKVLSASRGNWKEIVRFLHLSPVPLKKHALDLLTVISEKDLHDTPKDVLLEHLLHADDSFCKDKKLFTEYVLNPHISNELLSSYKELIQTYFGFEFITDTRRNINTLVQWINDSITLSDANTSRTPIKPKGVLELRYADKHSRDLFFVAACRSFGIPSRIEESRSIPQVFLDNNWTDVSFEQKRIENNPKAHLTFIYSGGLPALKPEYYIHFTLARFNGSLYRTIDYEFNNIFNEFPATVTVDTGRYAIVTGNRLQNGTVLAKIKYFTLSENEHKAQIFEFNQKNDTTETGSINLNNNITLITANDVKENRTLKDLAYNTGLILIWIDPDKEPTKHLINDLNKLRANFDSWRGNFVFLIPPEKYSDEFSFNNYKSLPRNSFFSVDAFNLFSSVISQLSIGLTRNYPVVIVSDKTGNVYYTSSGYKIGCGEQILNTVNKKCIYH